MSESEGDCNENHRGNRGQALAPAEMPEELQSELETEAAKQQFLRIDPEELAKEQGVGAEKCQAIHEVRSPQILLVYGFRVLGGNLWLRRLGWVSPRHGFSLYSLVAGTTAGGAVCLLLWRISGRRSDPEHITRRAILKGSLLVPPAFPAVF